MKFQSLLITVFIFCTQLVISQNLKLIDSLKNALDNHIEEDSVRVDILTELHEKLMFSSPLKAKKYAEEELKISKKIDYKMGIGKGLLHLGDFYTNRSNLDSALYYYKQAKQEFSNRNSYRGTLFVNYSIADILRSKGDFESAIHIILENLELIEENEKVDKAKAKFKGAQYNSLATIYMEKGNYKLALIEALKALELFTEINDVMRKADILKLLGDLEYATENHKKALTYFKEAMAIYLAQNDEIYLSYAKNSAGNALKKLNRINEAQTHYEEAIKLARKHEAKSPLANALYNLGELFNIEKKYEKAKASFIESKEITEGEDIKIGIINAYKGLSNTFKNENNIPEAIKNINQAINIAEKIGTMSNLQELYEKRSNLFRLQNKNKEALSDLHASQKIRDSLFSVKKSQQIEELRTIYETEKKEAAITLQKEEIKNLNQQVEISNLRKTLYAGGMISFIVVSGLLFFGFRQRIKKNQIEREKQEEIYRQEIEFKRKELTSQTLHLVQKSSFIQELKENLERIKNSPELFKVEFRRLVMLLKKESAEDKDWEVFKSYFADVHNNFDNKLKAIHNEITEKEIRLASFLRMNLTTKEIATMLNVLPDSVLKSKYRLKKKLQLGKEEDLYEFLNTL
ncbi:tetratricopeptide repeat protein [uncultured Aquimarina sp.]|uniref:tetratricopeptide repeat protein n=1 Tax=uncultured Aquimarina sp. TaxID=575652 RepID=UPI00262B8580|nr:tetratricopeptide repeat protein [uncultured Aquimarina sp.]